MSQIPRKSIAGGVLDAIGSVPFGVTMMVLVLLWCWVGSAGTAPFGAWFVRQTFEKTEMEWFSWWPFNVLLGALALALILVTVRRIKFNLPNLGVWVIHSGIVVLILGGAIYFGLKVEGDMAVYRRQAVVRVDGGPPKTIVLRGGERAIVQGNGRVFRVEVASLRSDYELLTGKDKGRRTYAAQLAFEPLDGAGQAFVRQLLAGYPEYTEDVVPGAGRAIKVLGRALVDPGVDAALEYAPVDRIHVMDRFALGVRPAADADAPWTEYPLRGLPRYREYVSMPGDAWVRTGEPGLPVRPLDLAPRPRAPRPELADIGVRVTGYLPYAVLQESWEPGGTAFNPYVDVTVRAGGSASRHALLAEMPGHERAVIAGAVPLTFRWLHAPDELQALLQPGAPFLRVRARGVTQDIALGDASAREVAIKGTPYRLALQRFEPDWSAAGELSAMALVRVSGGARPFLRTVVAPRSDLTQDLDVNGQRLPGLADPTLEITLENIAPSGLTIAGSDEGAHALLVSNGGQVLHERLVPGTPARFLDGALEVTLHTLSRSAQRVGKPVIVPRQERDQKAGPAYSLVKFELRRGDDVRTGWLEYSHYNHPSRVGFYPRRVEFPGAPPLDVVFTRETHPLPSAVALEDFRLETFPGGDRERDYISLVRFREDGKFGEPKEVHSNNPTEHAGWWFFQSTWDPPEPRSGYSGMNYTGLGVGNRHGVAVLLLGSVMTVLGTIWAFYVKPVILRGRIRAIEQARAVAAGARPPVAETGTPAGAAVPAGGQP